MDGDARDQQKREIRKYERERDWIPLLLAATAGALRYWKEGVTDGLTPGDYMIFGGIFMILWAVLDLRVMMIRLHWAMLQK